MELSENSLGGASQKPDRNMTTDKDLDAIIAELVTNGSIELSTSESRQITEASDLLPVGMCVYVPSVSKQTLSENIEHIQALHAAGFDAVLTWPLEKLYPAMNYRSSCTGLCRTAVFTAYW